MKDSSSNYDSKWLRGGVATSESEPANKGSAMANFCNKCGAPVSGPSAGSVEPTLGRRPYHVPSLRPYHPWCFHHAARRFLRARYGQSSDQDPRGLRCICRRDRRACRWRRLLRRASNKGKGARSRGQNTKRRSEPRQRTTFNSGSRSGRGSKGGITGDACRSLSKEEVSRAIGVEIVATQTVRRRVPTWLRAIRET